MIPMVGRQYAFLPALMAIFLYASTDATHVTYKAINTYRRWVDAKRSCPGESFLARIKNSTQLLFAKASGVNKFQEPHEYWIGLKYSTPTNGFLWADGTEVNWNADLDAIVNKNKQKLPYFKKRCYLLTLRNTLVAETCGKLKKYICQTGETDDEGNVHPTTSAHAMEPSPRASTELIREYSRNLQSLNAGEKLSLQKAANYTSYLLKDLREIDAQEGRVLVAGKELEAFGMKYAKHHNNSKSITDEEIELRSMTIEANVTEDVVFSATRRESQIANQETEHIRLPASLFKGQGRIVVCILYKNITRLMRRASRFLHENVLATGGIKTNVVSCALEPAITGTLTENTTILLHAQENGNGGLEDCVFWNFSTHAPYGSWSRRGCSVVESNHERIKCTCNHLTNFAVFMQVDDIKISGEHQKALAIITYIGCGLSLLGETLTLMTYGLLMKLKTEIAHIRFNLAMSIAIAQILFLSGVEATNYQGFCISVAALIHYFYLVGFMWMLVEGLVLYVKVVKVFNITIKLNRFYITSWGLPALVVAASLAMASSFEEGIKSYIQDQLCWLSFSNNLIWMFVVPVIIVVLINSIVITSVVKEIAKLGTGVQNEPEGLHIRQSLKACITLFPLLGLTWIFGILSVTADTGLVFQYMFTALNSLQGFFIFILYVLKSKEVMASLQRKKEVWNMKKSVHDLTANRHETGTDSARRKPVVIHPHNISVSVASRQYTRNNRVLHSSHPHLPTDEEDEEDAS